uniref:Uncharacterized protein n=1 Tax=Cacopsylla melanoneura TaxID=428564 RepID=A0A8D8WS55_9HEMI
MQSAHHVDSDDNAELPSVSRKSLAMQSARHEDSDDNVELPSVPRKSLAMQSARHEDSDSTVEPIHPALADLNESDQEPRVAPPRRKSFAPRKSVNFRNRDLDSSGEMEFTCAFPAMARPPVEEENDGSEMEETEVFPRKYVGPRQSTELNIPDKGDFMWRRSLPNKTNLTKSMETSNTSQLDLESRKSTGMNNLQNVFPQQYDQDSSMELTTFVPLKSLRKSVGRMMLKTSEHLDESGMEITEVLHGLPSNAHMDDTRSEEYDVSMSEAISDMEISSYSPPNVTTTNQSMMTVDQTKPNVSAGDSIIATGGLNRKSLGPRIQNNENLKIKHLARYPTSTSTHLQHKSFSGFENSAMDLSTAPSRKSAPICIVPAQHDENETLPQSTSEDGSPNISVSVGVPITSMNADQHRVNPNMVLNSSVNDQSLQTTDIHSILPMAHSTNLNLTETKSSPVAKATTKQNLASENHFNVTSESNPNKSADNMSMSMESTCTLPQSTELVSNKMDNSNMELSSVINQKSTREFNLTATDETTGETNTCQQTTQSKRENTNMSVNDISIDKSVACEDMSLAETMTIHVNETFATGAILPETEVLVSDVKENSTNPSQFESDSAVMSSSSGESKDNSVSTVLSEGTTGNNDENEQPNMNTTKLENKSDKTESKKVLQVSVDDGFSSTQNSRQSLESALSTSCVLDISKMSCDLVQVERPRKRPSDGFEVHDENLVQDENKMVVANPKKRSKTFEVDIEDKEGNEVEINSENMAKESEETTTTKQSFHSHSMITPVKTPIQLVQTPTMVTNFTETVDKPFTFATPAKTHVVKSTPNKTSTFVTPVQVANKTPQFITPSNNLTFRTPGKTPIKTPTLTTPGRAPVTEADVNFSHESLHSSNVSTYANPSSTLTDSVINNLTDKEIPLPGSTIKQTPSEMKAKQHQSASCSTPLLPNSCNKNVIVDMFFQSFNKTHDKPEGFSAPSKNIIKKLIMTQEKQKQTIEEETTSDENKSASQDASPENASLDINPTLKRTKDQLNISEHNDLNSSNYIPEKQQRNVMSDIGDVVKDNVVCLNISEQSDIGDVVKPVGERQTE